MKKLLILALTSAFVAAANADATINWGVTTSTLTNASWNDDNAPGVVGSVFKIDADVGDGVALLPSGTAPAPQVKTVVTIDATFTAISDYSSLDQLGTDAKTALTVAKDSNDTPHYYYWNPLSSDENKWTLLGTTATPNTEQAVTVVIELDYTLVNSPKAKFKIGNTTPVEVDLSSETTLTGLAFAGTGDLTSVAATVTPAYATKAVNDVTTRYATVADAVNATGDGAVTLYKHNGAFGTMPTVADKLYFPVNVNDNYGTASLYSFTKVDGDYQITSAADLIALKDAVANVPAARSLSYKQTANIDMASAGAFAGIGTYAKVPTAGTPFTGTYDGQNHKILNVTRAGGDTQGIFNQVGTSGVIENLVVENMTFDSNITEGEYGCAIVGNAGGGATLRNLTAEGVFGSADKPSTHNMAGIVVRLSPGATAAGAATTIDSCTNNATIYGSYTKMGGICAIAQTQTGFKDGKVVFVNCANTGTLVCKRTEAQCAELDNENKPKIVTGNAGILGYSTANVELAGCYSNGAITNNDGANTDKDGALVGWAYDKTLKDNGGNSAPNDKKMIGYYGSAAITGFKYATVDNGVATTVTLPLAANTTYLLEGNVAASETPVFTLAANGDYIEFNTSLGYTFGGTVAAAQGLVAKSTTSGNVTTYTADEGYEVVSTAETALVAVPANCNAAGLISTDNRDTGDILKVYSKGDKCYYTWTLTGAKGTWDPLQTWVINGEAAATSHSKPASEVELSAGQAAWLTRKSAASKNAKIILLVVAEGNTIPATVQKGYNLVAPPPKAGASTITIDEVVADDATGKDKVFIPAEGKAPYNLDFKDGHWGYDKYTIENGQLKKVRIIDVTIPAGTGFFYINNGDAAKSVTLGSED